MYTKESLENLRQKIDLFEVLSAHLSLQRTGHSYKTCCPFHDEKTPSFIYQVGDTHYHCFGCGAHGDAISFLMQHVKMGFIEAVESLAERFGVILEKQDKGSLYTVEKKQLKELLEKASQFYHFYLLHTKEGHLALDYLYKRGIDLEFVELFGVGLAPKPKGLFQAYMKECGYNSYLLEQAGLVYRKEDGYIGDYFSDRVTFPIRDALGFVIGFSARKIHENTYGGKYINTPETILFKKSHVLFGLSYSRKRITKERFAIVVEGQIDALRLIQEGFNVTVAGQGTAFGEDHVKELLQLGVLKVYLALDGDDAGREATVKIGDLFQKKGIEVFVVKLPVKEDPDTFLRKYGPDAFRSLLEKSEDYLQFFYEHASKDIDISSPSMKSDIMQLISNKIRGWEEPIMVYESLRKLAKIANVPETLLGVSGNYAVPVFVKRRGKVGDIASIDPDKILECDLLRWLLLMGAGLPRLVDIAKSNLKDHHFKTPACQELYLAYLDFFERENLRDLLSFTIQLEDEKLREMVDEILQKKVNTQKTEDGFIETLQKVLQRFWMEERENIKIKMYSGQLTDDQAILLAKQFDEIKKNPPKVIMPL